MSFPPPHRRRPGLLWALPCLLLLLLGSFDVVLGGPPGSVSGALRRDVFRGIPGTFVTDLLESPAFPDAPTVRQLRTSFESPQADGENYGQILYGWITPTTTAQYRFFIAGDDTAALYLATNEVPARLQRIAHEPEWSSYRAYTATDRRPNRENISTYRTLQAGKSYFVLALSKQGFGGDSLSVAWQALGGTPIADGGPPISGSVLSYSTNAQMLRSGPASVLIGPAARSLEVGDTLVLSTLAAGAPPLTYEWLRNGVVIPASNSPVLTIPGIRSSHAGAYSVRVSNAQLTNTSATASVTIRTVPTVAGPIVNPANSNRYYVVGPSSWSAAEEASRALGGHLATVRSQAENTWIYNTFSDYSYPWIGLSITNFKPVLAPLTADQMRTRFGWSSDESVPYRNWNTGEPSNGGGFEYLVTLLPGCCGGPGWNDWVDWWTWPVDGADTRVKFYGIAEVRTNRMALPSITLQPAGETNYPGTRITLSVEATGLGILRYQWERDGWPLNGANLSQLSIPSLKNSDAGVYLVRVRNAGGITVSATARIGVLPPAVPPLITVDPASQSVVAGSNVTLFVTATGTAPLSYQWWRGSKVLAGQTASSLLFPSMQLGDAGTYSVVVSNVAGSVRSSDAVLNVLPPPDPPVIVKSGIVSTNIVAGQSLTLWVQASGTGPLGYQWWRGNQPLAGQTASNLVFPSIQLGDSATYSVVVSNVAKAVRSGDAVVTVLPPPQPPALVKSGVLSTNILLGRSLTLWVQAAGTAPLNYQWWRGGQPLLGQTASNLVFPAIQLADQGVYSVVVSNVVTSIRSPDAIVTVTPAPEPPRIVASNLAPTNRMVGEPLTLWVQVAGTSPLSYQWWRGGEALPGQISSNLVFASLQLDDAGSFSVVVSNAVSSIHSPIAVVSVSAAPVPPQILDWPVGELQGFADQPFSLKVGAAGSGALTYRWFKDGRLLSASVTSSLVLSGLRATDAGAYSVEVSSPLGSVRTPEVRLTVLVPSAAGAGPILMVHGHADTPLLWRNQGPNLTNATHGARFYDPVAYGFGQLPAQFKANGIYGVTYYARMIGGDTEPAVISPVFNRGRELKPDEDQWKAPLANTSDSYAARLASIINQAYADTGRKVTLVCHSMGGLVSLSAITWFGCWDKVETIVTIGSPLRGFPPDFRIPAEIIALDRLGLYREGIQMSEGVKYEGLSFTERLESEFKSIKPPGLRAVNIVGTHSPFPEDLLKGPNDGVVRTIDARFRQASLATVYELPLTHTEEYKVERYPDADVECLSPMTTQVLEKEILGLNPVPRIRTSISFNYATSCIRVTVKNEGGLPVNFSSVSGSFAFLGKSGHTEFDPLSELRGKNLRSGEQFSMDALRLNRGGRGDIQLTLRVNGYDMAPSESVWIANLQAPEIEANFRYDLINGLLRSEWASHVGGFVRPIKWAVHYRLAGRTRYDAQKDRLEGWLSAELYTPVVDAAGKPAEQSVFSEAFDFDLDVPAQSFSEVRTTVLGKTPVTLQDAASSRLRELYKTKLLPLVDQPGDFLFEGEFSAAAGITLHHPVLRYSEEDHGLAVNLNATLYFAFSDGDEDHVIDIPMLLSCSMVPLNTDKGLVLRPRIRKFATTGFTLSEPDRAKINELIEETELVLVPRRLTDSLNEEIWAGLKNSLQLSPSIPAPRFVDSAVLGIDPGPESIRLLVDLYDDATDGGGNRYAGVPQNGVAIQDRLLTELLNRTRSLVNESPRTSIPIHNAELKMGIPGLDYSSAFGGLGFGVQPVIGYAVERMKLRWGSNSRADMPKEEEALFTALLVNPLFLSLSVAELLQNNEPRELRIGFDGENNGVQAKLPIDLFFDNRLKLYARVRIGFELPWGDFIGYEKDIYLANVGFKELLAVDVAATIHPHVRPPSYSSGDGSRSGPQSNIGVDINPRQDLDFSVRFNQSLGLLIPVLAEVAGEPLFRVARDRPDLIPPLATLVGGLIGYFAPGIVSESLVDAGTDEVVKQVSKANGPDSDEGRIRDKSGRFKVGLRALGKAAENNPWASAVIGAGLLGKLASDKMGDIEEAFKTRSLESSVVIGGGASITNLVIAKGAASLFFDVAPSYGDLSVISIEGVDSNGALVPLTRHDYVLQTDETSQLAPKFEVGGEYTPFRGLWVKKPVAKLRLRFRHDAMYGSRYNSPATPGYHVLVADLDRGLTSYPSNYAFDSEKDYATFTTDVALVEGVTALQGVRLQLPNVRPVTFAFVVGRDTAPLLINAPFAGYSGVSSNLSIQAGTLSHRNAGAPQPTFALQQLKLVSLDHDVRSVDLKPLGALTTRSLNPADTRIPELYGVNYAWVGNLPTNQFPEGLYTVLATIRDTAMGRSGSLLIPFVMDRTPPVIKAWLEFPDQFTVSRHVRTPLVWHASDRLSTLLNNVNVTYRGSGGTTLTSVVYAAEGEVLSPGQRRLAFDVAPETIRDDVEEVYQLQFHASDASGNRASSTNITFIYDTLKPAPDGVFLYPGGLGPYASIVTRTNRILTINVYCHEPFTGRLILSNEDGSENAWPIQSSPVPGEAARHLAQWIQELPESDPLEGLLEGAIGDGEHKLSIEMVDRGLNTNRVDRIKTLLIDRKPPPMSFRSQTAFLAPGRTVFPLDVDTSGFAPEDRVTRIALFELNGYSPGSVLSPVPKRSWTGKNEINQVRQSGISMASELVGQFLPAGHYGVEVVAQDDIGNESRITTQFAFQVAKPHVEVAGGPVVSGVVPIVGVAVDPNPGDRFPFRSRELYWTPGANRPIPADLSIDGLSESGWTASGFYVLPPRGPGFEASPNTSAEMVPAGTLAYWNTTSTALSLAGNPPVSLSAAGIMPTGDATVLLVVRDQGGQSWADAATVRIDNRQVDSRTLSAPGVAITRAAVTSHQLTVDAGLFADTRNLQMVIVDATGNGVHRSVRSSAQARNKFLERPSYSLENDFGFFVWYDPASAQVRVRCVAPERDSSGAILRRGHTFFFSLGGSLDTNDLIPYLTAPGEVPQFTHGAVGAGGSNRFYFALQVDPGKEKGIAVTYHGGAIAFNALGIDEYVQGLYLKGSSIEKRSWRVDDPAALPPGYFQTNRIINLGGLDGSVLNGSLGELPDPRAIANHSGAIGHVFVGQSRNQPLSPLNLVFDSAVVRSDLSLDWDLRLPNGNSAEPGNYTVYLYTVDDRGKAFHGAVARIQVKPGDVPFAVGGLRLASQVPFTPGSDPGVIVNLNVNRSTRATVEVLNSAGQVVSTVSRDQVLGGRTDTNAPYQFRWDGFVDGKPAAAGDYSFRIATVSDGTPSTTNGGTFKIQYPTEVARESDWRLMTQPIAFDPDSRDRITRPVSGPARALVTLHFDAQLADGTEADTEMQIPLTKGATDFEADLTDPATGTYIPVSSRFRDALVRFEGIQVKYNHRVVDTFPAMDVAAEPGKWVRSRSGQFHFQVKDPGPKAVRLKVVVRARVRPWMTGLWPMFTEQNLQFDPNQPEPREFSREVEFRQVAGDPDQLVSVVDSGKFRYQERLWGYSTNGGLIAPKFGWAQLDKNDIEVEIWDSGGGFVLDDFTSDQFLTPPPPGTTSQKDRFSIESFKNVSTGEQIGLDFVFRTRLSDLQREAPDLRMGYAAVNALLKFSDPGQNAGDLDPFPTRYYHLAGLQFDTVNPGRKYDDVKAYSGDSALVQEVMLTNSLIAGHIPFQYTLHPYRDGEHGQQTMQIHPWVPYFFKKAAGEDQEIVAPEISFSFGSAICAAGDVNGDGYDDVAIADDYYWDGVSARGRVYVYYGGPEGLSKTPDWTMSPFGLGGGEWGQLSPWVHETISFGYSLASGGDVNGDGFDDLVVGAPNLQSLPMDQNNRPWYFSRPAGVFVFFGGPNGLASEPSWVLRGEVDYGTTLAKAGDVNGDGLADILIGAPGYKGYAYDHIQNRWVYLGAAEASVVLGDRTGSPGTSVSLGSHLWSQTSPTGYRLRHEEDKFGISFAGGDWNGDGFADVMIGAPGWWVELPDDGGNFHRYYGHAILISGARDFAENLPSRTLEIRDGGWNVVYQQRTDDTGFFLNGDGYDLRFYSYPGDRVFALRVGDLIYGADTIANAGDIDGDRRDDLVVGASRNATGTPGSVEVYSGSTFKSFWSTRATQTQTGFGKTVSSGGDINKDGFAEVLIGEPGYTGYDSQNVFHSGRVLVHSFPKQVSYYTNWVRGGPGGEVYPDDFPKTPTLKLINLLPVPLVIQNGATRTSVQVTNFFDATLRKHVVKVQYVTNTVAAGNAGPSGITSFSGFVTNAPFPLLREEFGPWWASNGFYDAKGIATNGVPVDVNNERTNRNWLVSLKFAVLTNDMLLASNPHAYDVTISDGLIDYTHTASTNWTINYGTERTAWAMIDAKLPPVPPGNLPSVDRVLSHRPRVMLTNIVLKPDPSFPPLQPADIGLHLQPPPGEDGGERSYVITSFDHRSKGYFKPWSLADDPNIQVAQSVQPEDVKLTVILTNDVYFNVPGSLPTRATATNRLARILLDDVPVKLTNKVDLTRLTSAVAETGSGFSGYKSASLWVRVTRDSGESEAAEIINLDLNGAPRDFPVRTTRYQWKVTPSISGNQGNLLGFSLTVRLDPPEEYSIRKPLRRGDRVALPLHVVDREKFWQLENGEYSANLFDQVRIGLPGQAPPGSAGYVIDSIVGYESVDGRRPLATDSDYAAKAGALFWRLPGGRIQPNPRIIPGDIQVVLKDPSGEEESTAFWNRREVAPAADEYFNDLYIDRKSLARMSWTAKIRPQAKEHAYVKVYGSVGGEWKLSFRKKEPPGSGTGLLSLDAGTIEWSLIASNKLSRGQNQFLTYWDVTELNGPHILRLESTESPDNSSLKPEVKYLEVMLGQHLPGTRNPIFSPEGKASTVSLFSMHGRTQLSSDPHDRQPDDFFFTLNPMQLNERPFSLPTDGSIPKGERVQVLPHTETNAFTVSFYMDRESDSAYGGDFKLYHQLEGGELVAINTFAPKRTKSVTEILGYVEHTSIVGFLPNASLRYCTLDVPGKSRDGIISVAGRVDLYGTDQNGRKNEDLMVSIVVSTNADFYSGRVRARLTTGAKAEFPVASEASQALISSGWQPGMPEQRYYVFAVVVSAKDDWLKLDRQLTPGDVNQHLLNYTEAQVAMQTNLTSSVTVEGIPVLSPNRDGVADTVTFNLDFQRSGLIQLDVQNELQQVVHRVPVPLSANGQARFTWDGSVTGQGALQVAPDGFYRVTARYADGRDTGETAAVDVEVRSASSYQGHLNPEGITNVAGIWHTLWSQAGNGLHSADSVRIQYSDTPDFDAIRGDRPVDRGELSALFDDTLKDLSPFPRDPVSGAIAVHYRLRVDDEVGNIGYSSKTSVLLPGTGSLKVVSVTPANGAVNVSTEPAIVISLAEASPFDVQQLDAMFQISPAIPRVIRLLNDRRSIVVTLETPFPAGTQVTAALRTYPSAQSPGTGVFTWAFRVLPSNLISRDLLARVVGIPAKLEGMADGATAYVSITNRGNVPARIALNLGSSGTNGVQLTTANGETWIPPLADIVIPVSLTVTGEYRGNLYVPVGIVEQTIGAVTSLWVTASINAVTSAPTVQVSAAVPDATQFLVRFTGRSRARFGVASTLGRLNGGSWWQLSTLSDWTFDARFAADGDTLEVVSVDDRSNVSEVYRYRFRGPALELGVSPDRSLFWDAQLGRTYSLEWSEDLIHWKAVEGNALQKGMSLIVSPGTNPIQIGDSVVGRVAVVFSPAPELTLGTNAFLRVRSDR